MEYRPESIACLHTLFAITIFVGCQTPDVSSRITDGSLVLRSPAFEPENVIPERYGCSGSNFSPPLSWTIPPTGTVSLYLMLVRNEGAQDDDFPAMESLWEVANLPASLTGLDENLSPGIEKLIISPQAIQLPNQFGRVGYDGPCPSTEERGRYTFMLFALDTHFPEAEMHPLETRWRFIDRHLVARAELSGYFDYTRRE